jgi:hypothetical protein
MVLAAGMALTGCVADEPVDTDGRLTLFTRMDAPATRATVDGTWVGGEQVQVSIDNAPAVMFTAEASGALTPNGMLYWYWQSAGQSISARAWYPDNWAMEDNQSTEAGYRAADFIFAPTVTGITLATTASKPLTFYHKTAKVTANLTTGAGISDVSGATVAFYGYTSGTANTASGTISGNTNGWIQPLKSGNSHTALLIPQSLTTPAFIKVTLGGFDYSYTPPATLNLEAGKSYIFNITVNKTGLSVTSSSSPSWSKGSEDDLTAVPA